MSEMMERVARVLFTRRYEGETNLLVFGVKTTFEEMMEKIALNEVPSEVADALFCDARVVIEAMREPTEEMAAARVTTLALTKNHDGSPVGNMHPPIRQPDNIDAWQAMIDEALK